MRTSNPNALLSGLLVTAACFAFLFVMFSAVIGFGMLYAGWVDFFHPNPYLDALIICVCAAAAGLCIRGMAVWVTSRP